MPKYDGSPTRAEKKAANRAKYAQSRERGPAPAASAPRSGSLTSHQQQLMREAEAFASQHYGSGRYEERRKEGNAILRNLLKAGIPPAVIASTPTAAHHEMRLLTYLGPIGSAIRDTREMDPRKGLELAERADQENKEIDKKIAMESAKMDREHAQHRAHAARTISKLSATDRAYIREHREDVQDSLEGLNAEADQPDDPSVAKIERMLKRVGLDLEDVFDA